MKNYKINGIELDLRGIEIDIKNTDSKGYEISVGSKRAKDIGRLKTIIIVLKNILHEAKEIKKDETKYEILVPMLRG